MSQNKLDLGLLLVVNWLRNIQKIWKKLLKIQNLKIKMQRLEQIIKI
jgi:hypothetical protein